MLWAAGVEAPPLAAALAKATGAEHDRAGRIAVDDNLTIPGHPEISVIGDLMSHGKLPGVAEVAMQSGSYTAKRIKYQAKGKPIKPFRYHDLGSAAYISRGRGVLSVGRLSFGGFIGWLGWLLIHIAFLTGFRNRLGTILTWWTAFTVDTRRERVFTTRRTGLAGDVYPAPPTVSAGTGTQAADAAAITPNPVQTGVPVQDNPDARRLGGQRMPP